MKLVRLYIELSKARLSALVLLTTAVGFFLADAKQAQSWTLLLALSGTALAAFGVNALNQWMEVDRDGRMERTRERPLPSGQMDSRHALAFAVIFSIAGPLLLALFVNALTAVLCFIIEVLYIVSYTPLKTRSSLCTLVGAVCGAIPPMMGWSAATGSLAPGAWILGAILFAWQIPHFLALAWLYREDYQKGGFKMLSVTDLKGNSTCRMVLIYSATLIPLGLCAALTGMAGGIYAVGSLFLGGLFLLAGVRLYKERSLYNARRLFWVSLVYLPLLLTLMALDRPKPVDNSVHILASVTSSAPHVPSSTGPLPPSL